MEKENLLEKFLNEENIFVSNKRFDMGRINFENIIDAVVDFHSSMVGKKNYTLGIISEIGKAREEQKLFIRRVKTLKKEINIDCEEILEKAIRSTHMISTSEFLSLVNRAVINSEITIGKNAINTFKSGEGKIFIKESSRVQFGMREDDFVKIIIKFRKRENNFDYDHLKKIFLEKEKLDDKSSRYIDSILKFPYKEMKYLSQVYINDFKNIDIINSKLASFGECGNYN